MVPEKHRRVLPPYALAGPWTQERRTTAGCRSGPIFKTGPLGCSEHWLVGYGRRLPEMGVKGGGMEVGVAAGQDIVY